MLLVHLSPRHNNAPAVAPTLLERHALFYFYLIIIIVVLWFSEKHHFLIPDFKIQKNQNDVFFRIIEGEQ